MDTETFKRLNNGSVLDALTFQKRAHDALVRVLQDKIGILEQESEEKSHLTMTVYTFLADFHKDLVPEFVRLAYLEDENNEGHARESIAFLHDEILDLSTIPTTGDDFEPWRSKP